MALDEAKLNQFIGKFVQDVGAVFHAATVILGDKLGLYKAMADGLPVTPDELAERTGNDRRYVREWLSAQAASGYAEYDAAADSFRLNEEQIFALTNEQGPMFLPGAFQLAGSTFQDLEKILDAFQTGSGVGWHEHHTDLFLGTERFFRPNYIANLVTSWIPALEGVADKLRAGAKVADIGCGHGASTLILAEAFPKSTFHGFDYHEASIRSARDAASRESLSRRVQFETAPAKSYPGDGYDLVAFFDCLHDMGDPVGVAEHVRKSLKPDGTWMIVEPFANDDLEKNLSPLGRIFYSVSTTVCTPASRAQEVGLALGAQAGEKRIRDVVQSGGFTRFRRAAETPFNLIFEARP
jgi:2-polyprenyl-3-methyl-5-hydroxy-6-metoxy-1,4-benzoquinol methylase